MDPGKCSRLERAFVQGSGHGLLVLGAEEVGTPLPPVLSFWRNFAARYVTALCARPGIVERTQAARADPRARGVGHAGRGRSANDRRGIPDDGRVGQSMEQHGFGLRCRIGPIQSDSTGVPQEPSSGLELVGACSISTSQRTARTRTCGSRFSQPTRHGPGLRPAQHLPLGKALQEYAGARNRERLLSLLMPVQRAAENCPWLKAMVDAGARFFTRCAGTHDKRCISSATCPLSKAPGWSCGCRRVGA